MPPKTTNLEARIAVLENAIETIKESFVRLEATLLELSNRPSWSIATIIAFLGSVVTGFITNLVLGK